MIRLCLWLALQFVTNGRMAKQWCKSCHVPKKIWATRGFWGYCYSCFKKKFPREFVEESEKWKRWCKTPHLPRKLAHTKGYCHRCFKQKFPQEFAEKYEKRKRWCKNPHVPKKLAKHKGYCHRCFKKKQARNRSYKGYCAACFKLKFPKKYAKILAIRRQQRRKKRGIPLSKWCKTTHSRERKARYKGYCAACFKLRFPTKYVKMRATRNHEKKKKRSYKLLTLESEVKEQLLRDLQNCHN